MPGDRSRFLGELNRSYSELHTRWLDALWAAYMGLTPDADEANAEMGRRELEYFGFLQDPERLDAVSGLLAEAEIAGDVPTTELLALRGWLATFEANAMASAEARDLAAQILLKEGDLARARGSMELGYRHPDRGFVRASAVELNVMLDGEPREDLRRAAWDGLRSIEQHVLRHGFLDLVRMRNERGRMLGGDDFYDWKVRRVEGLTKAEVFDLLEELEDGTRPAGDRGLALLHDTHGQDAVTPWNERYLSSGDVTREQDPYFPLEKAIERWGTCFAALGLWETWYPCSCSQLWARRKTSSPVSRREPMTM